MPESEHTFRVGLLDVPEPEGLALEYQYDRYSNDESRVPDRTLRRLVFSGRVPGPVIPSPFGVDSSNYTEGVDVDEIEEVGNYEDRLSSNKTVMLSRNTSEFTKDVRDLIGRWADSSNLRVSPEVVFAEELGYPPRGIDASEQGISSVEVSENYAESLLGPAFSVPLSTQVRSEPIWRALESRSPATQIAVQRIGVFVEVHARRLWEESEYERLNSFMVVVKGGGPEFSQALDALHGYSYRFSVRSLYFAYVVDPSTGLDLDQSERLGLVVLSRSRSVSVDSVDLSRPSPPTDLLAVWDYDKSALRLRWTMPQDPKGTIKRLQLFGRSGFQEPYSLVREWDWNDNEVNWTREAREQEPVGRRRTEKPVGWFYDPAFQPRSGFVRHYALVAQTTHGVNSTYSIQVTVRWVNAQIGVVCYLLSRSGAPKPYPNLLLENLQIRKAGIALDLVSVGGTGRITVLHDPEVSGIEGMRDYQTCDYIVTTLDHNTLQKTKQTLR